MPKFNRWVYLGISMVVLFFSGLIYAWSIFKIPIAEEFSTLTKAQLELVYTTVMLAFLVGSLLSGFFAEKVRIAANVRICACLFLIGFLIAANAHSLFMLCLGFGALCGTGTGASYNIIVSTMNRGFPDKTGLASGILLTAFGFSSFSIGKLFQAFTPTEIGGWRTSFTVLGITIFVVFMLCSFFIDPGKDFGADIPVTAKTAKAVGKDHTAGQMMKSPKFWCYYLWTIVAVGAGLALIGQASGVAKMAIPSLSAGTVATFVGIISICNAFGRILVGIIYDKFGRGVSMQFVNLCFALTAALAVVALHTGNTVALLCSFVFGGLGYAGVTPTNSAFCRAYFGTKHYALNFSIINSNLIVSAFSSTAASYLLDTTGKYDPTFYMILAFAVIGVFCSAGIALLDKKSK